MGVDKIGDDLRFRQVWGFRGEEPAQRLDMAGGACERVDGDFCTWKILNEAQASGFRCWRARFWELAGVEFGDIESVCQANELGWGCGLADRLRRSRRLLGLGG